jgi:hypothetical protein
MLCKRKAYVDQNRASNIRKIVVDTKVSKRFIEVRASHHLCPGANAHQDIITPIKLS